jgi:hypothetical protein
VRTASFRLAVACLMLGTASIAQAQLGPPPALPPMQQPIQTDKGKVQGYPGIEKGVVAFVGIPFGAPPVGDLRWKVPQPVAPWEGVLDTKTFKPACIQNSGLPRYKNAAVDEQHSPGMSEDCLYLNVWTGAAAANEKRPTPTAAATARTSGATISPPTVRFSSA